MVIRSFILVVPPYILCWNIKKDKAHAEIMGKMNEGFQSDDLKGWIRNFKQRHAEGKAETYEDIFGEKLDARRGGVSDKLLEIKEKGDSIDDEMTALKVEQERRMKSRMK